MPVRSAKSVLLVEDDVLVRECLAEVLGNAGWQVATAASAGAALDRMEAGRVPDMLMADRCLGSGRESFALVAEARRRWPRLHAVLTSGTDAATLDMRPSSRGPGEPFSMGAPVGTVTGAAAEPAVAGCSMAHQP